MRLRALVTAHPCAYPPRMCMEEKIQRGVLWPRRHTTYMPTLPASHLSLMKARPH